MPVVGRTPYRNLILTGTTGVGKTGVGRIIAQRMADTHFIDIEVEIQKRQGYTAEQIRGTFGQARLNTIESEMVEEVSLHRSAIIAINGTTLLTPQNLQRMQETGPILCLTAALGEILRRLHVQRGGRFQDPTQRAHIIGSLKREGGVKQLGIDLLDTTNLSLEAVADQAIDFWLSHADL